MNGEPWWAKFGFLVAGWLLGLLSKELSEWITIWFRGPKLKVEFGDGEDCVTLTPESVSLAPDLSTSTDGVRLQVVFFARIRVSNGKPRTLTKCQASLVKVERADEQGGFNETTFKDSIALVWSYNAEAETVDIARGTNRYVDLVRIQNYASGFQPQLRAHSGDVFVPIRYVPLFNENGTLRFTVSVSCKT